MPIGEFLDRYSIIKLKYEYVGSEVEEEHQAYLEEFLNLLKEHPEWPLLVLLEQLYEINKEIWGFESDLRRGSIGKYDTITLTQLPQEHLLQLAAVGQAAINIRNTNRYRVKIKNDVVKKTGNGFLSPKIDHASEEVDVCSY